jgi:pimeloyl-ACP methyl ester carboxylesterase
MAGGAMILWLILAAWVAAAAYPFILEALRPAMNASRRKMASGAFAKLSQGTTHYQWSGAAEGPVAICVHGLTTPSFVWGPIAEELGRMGYRVLSYDLYGRGYSDRPKGAQTSDFFIRQLEDLTEDQGLTGPVTLLGYSMGGAIGAAYAAKHPDRVQHLALIAPAGFGHDLGPIADLAVKYTILGRWFALGFYPKSLRRSLEGERSMPSAIPGMVSMQIAETRLKGFAPAVLSSLRGILNEDLAPAHAALADAKLPVTAIWGEEDDVIPLACKDVLAERIPHAGQAVVPKASHAVAYTHVPEVMAPLKSNLS